MSDLAEQLAEQRDQVESFVAQQCATMQQQHHTLRDDLAVAYTSLHSRIDDDRQILNAVQYQVDRAESLHCEQFAGMRDYLQALESQLMQVRDSGSIAVRTLHDELHAYRAIARPADDIELTNTVHSDTVQELHSLHSNLITSFQSEKSFPSNTWKIRLLLIGVLLSMV